MGTKLPLKSHLGKHDDLLLGFRPSLPALNKMVRRLSEFKDAHSRS